MANWSPAPSPRRRAGDVAQRIERLGLVLVDNVTPEEGGAAGAPSASSTSRRPKTSRSSPAISRCCCAPARASMTGSSCSPPTAISAGCAPVVADIRSRVVAGESFAEALARHEGLFPPMYVALIRVGEASGSLDQVLEVLADERTRTEALKRRLGEAIRYPLFVLGAAGVRAAVLPHIRAAAIRQRAAGFRRQGRSGDRRVPECFDIAARQCRRGAGDIRPRWSRAAGCCCGRKVFAAASWMRLARLPAVREMMTYYRTSLFCRNLGLLLGSGVNLTTTLRILVDMMSSVGSSAVWTDAAERVRHGAKLSDALADTRALAGRWRCGCCGSATRPGNCRCWRAGSPNSTRPSCSARSTAWSAIAGPAAIIVISIVVGGLIVSVMTALMSVSQIVG